MAELKYPAALTPTHWAKHKGQLAKSKPTGIGEALTQLMKAHEGLDLAAFEVTRLDTVDAAEKALARYEKDLKKDFVKAFQQAKTVEDTATTATTTLKKAALVPKSAVEAAAAVAEAASDYAVALTAFRQDGVKALEQRLETLRQAAEDDVDENAAPDVIAQKLSRKLVDALKQVKARGEETGKPPFLFMMGVGKAASSLFVGPRAGAGHKPMLKKVLTGESGTLKYYAGQCLFESGAITFVGDDIPLGGFAKRLQKSLLESTGKKYKLRVRRSSGEVDEAGEEDGEAPGTPTVGTTPPETPTPTPTPTPQPPQTPSTAEQVLTQRMKQLLPRLQPLLLKGGKPAEALKAILEKFKEHVAAKAFDAATTLLDQLELQAQKLQTQSTTAPRQGKTDPKRDLLMDRARQMLAETEEAAGKLPGTATYRAGFLKRAEEALAQLDQWTESPPGDVVKRVMGLLQRVTLLKKQVAEAAIEGPIAAQRVKDQRLALTQAKSGLGDLSTGAGLALGPALADIEKRLDACQRLVDRGEFSKSKDQVETVKGLIAGLAGASSGYATHYPAYEVQRNAALQAIATLKRHAQASAIEADIQRIEAELKRIDCVATADNGWVKATKSVALILTHCRTTARLADAMQLRAAKRDELQDRLKESGVDEDTAKRLGAYAHKLLVEEDCTGDEALAMARDTDDFVKAGLNERDARVSARVCKSLTASGIPREKALVVGKVMRAGGTAEAVDAKAVGRQMSRLSVAALENLAANGIPTECFRGGVTEVMPDCIGVTPRGWDALNLTWDHVPGMYSNGQQKVLVGTMDDGGGGRKVPAKGESAGMHNGKSIAHGTDDLVGHEAGHAFDVSDGDVKSKNVLFRNARQADLNAGNLVKNEVRRLNPLPSTAQPAANAAGMFVTRDNYFVVRQEGGVVETSGNAGSQADVDAACSETFAESFAMYFAGTADRWPALKAFWENNPWGV
ncbi:MAG: hypothetical protein ACOVQT_06555 [Rubrivivax sp.]